MWYEKTERGPTVSQDIGFYIFLLYDNKSRANNFNCQSVVLELIFWLPIDFGLFLVNSNYLMCFNYVMTLLNLCAGDAIQSSLIKVKYQSYSCRLKYITRIALQAQVKETVVANW